MTTQEATQPCPCCGEGPLESSEAVENLRVPYGPPCSFVRNVEVCAKCGECGDFSNLNDARINAALEEATRVSVHTMLNDLERDGFSMPHLERSLDLPQKSLSAYKLAASR